MDGELGGVTTLSAYALLLLAALLEAGGDALVRQGLHTHRFGFLGAGAAVLFAYGLLVNMPSWDFGRLLGVYVTLFFVVAQGINFFYFGVRPTLPLLIGGALIVVGGAIIAFWRT
jgi:small multidrug resistance family-3 protein